ncbi:MAG: hypothetical protein RJB13_1084 [Pseudomonadota bacterium]|jgi:hypothetical protein
MWFGTIVGIDYSGAGHCCAGLSGLRVFSTEISRPEVQEVRPEMGALKHWSRQNLAHWLADLLENPQNGPVLVGIDHALSFPAEYFALHGIALDWSLFLDHFCQFWPMNHKEHTVKDVYEALKNKFGTPHGNARWRRLAEQKSKGAKSVFHFGVPGAVASSTHAGIPWIQYLRNHPKLAGRLHFWPFDGWTPKEGCSVITEVYPSLWNKRFEKKTLNQDQHDAFVIVQALMEAQLSGELGSLFDPSRWEQIQLSDYEKQLALIEGWILGLT